MFHPKSYWQYLVFSAIILGPLICLSRYPFAEAAVASFRLSQASRATPRGSYSFDVISMRPGKLDESPYIQWGLPDGYRARNSDLFATIFLTYFGPEEFTSGADAGERILNAPAWTHKERYDIEARVAEQDLKLWQTQGIGKPLFHAMLQSLLADRCKLVAHRTTVDTAVYAIQIRPRRLKLKQTTPDELPPVKGVEVLEGAWIVPTPPGDSAGVKHYGVSMHSLAILLSQSTSRPVIDRTGLKGEYDFTLLRKNGSGPAGIDPYDPFGPYDLERIGLKLVPVTAPMAVVVIDHIERPSSN